MSIDPLKSGSVPTPGRLGQTGAGSAQGARGGEAVRGSESVGPAATGSSAGQDRVQISSEYQSLVEQARAAGTTDASSLSPDRLRTVLDRLKSGFYDSAEVRDDIARKIQGDLGTTAP